MKKFDQLLKEIRSEADITQQQLAEILEVSTVLISKIEAGQKGASKAFINKLSLKMDVSPISLSPYMFVGDEIPHGSIEKKLFKVVAQLQKKLIKERSKNLLKYVK